MRFRFAVLCLWYLRVFVCIEIHKYSIAALEDITFQFKALLLRVIVYVGVRLFVSVFSDDYNALVKQAQLKYHMHDVCILI